MARPGLLRNRKFIRLARALDALAFGEVQIRGLGQSLALGSLEMLWSATYESGDDVVGTCDDVEALAGWNGPAGILFAALRDAGLPDRAGFIEEHPDRPGLYRVHDLWDHAPDYVRKRRQRETERRTKGAVLSQAADTDQSLTGHGPPNGRTPAPSPTPSPAPHSARPNRPTRVGVGSPAFEAVEHWRGTVWPRLSTAECPDVPTDQVQSLAALSGKHGPAAVTAAMDAAAADSFWHGKLDLGIFIAKFPRFLGRKPTGQQGTGRKKVVGVDDNGQPIFAGEAA